jgi:flagellar basal body L-ring protein FlgH
MKLKIFLSACALLAFSGCSGLLDSLRDESAAIDREAGYEQADASDDDSYRPRNLRGLSANNVKSFEPEMARGYGRRLANLDEADAGARSGPAGSAPPEYRRYTRQDFVDNSPKENSLWDDQGQNNYLFSHNRERQPGDLVTVDVEKELKREIQYQLWMTLPPAQRKKRAPASAGGAEEKDGEKTAQAEKPADKASDEKNRDAAEEAAKTNLAPGGKDDDIVRMEVAETLGNGLVRVVGQKRVIYRGVARVVEITALANNKDVDDTGRVKSSAFLDMKTQVIQ